MQNEPIEFEVWETFNLQCNLELPVAWSTKLYETLCCQVAKGEPAQTPVCTLNIVLPETIIPESGPSEPDLLELEKNYSFLRDGISECLCFICFS
jgi:hypothetical protein